MGALEDLIQSLNVGEKPQRFDVTPRRLSRMWEQAAAMPVRGPWDAANKAFSMWMAGRQQRQYNQRRARIAKADNRAFENILRGVREGYVDTEDDMYGGDRRQVYKPHTTGAFAHALQSNPRVMHNKERLSQAMTLGRMLIQQPKGQSWPQQRAKMEILTAREQLSRMAQAGEKLSSSGLNISLFKGNDQAERSMLRKAATPIGPEDKEFQQFHKVWQTGDLTSLKRPDPRVSEIRRNPDPRAVQRVGAAEQSEDQQLEEMVGTAGAALQEGAAREEEAEAIREAKKAFAAQMKARIRRKPKQRESLTGVPKAMLKSAVDLARGGIDAGRTAADAVERMRDAQADVIDWKREQSRDAQASMQAAAQSPRGSDTGFVPPEAAQQEAAASTASWMAKRKQDQRRSLASVRVRGIPSPVMKWSERDIAQIVKMGMFKKMTAQQKQALKLRIEELRNYDADRPY